GYIILDADKVLVPGSIVARLIGAQQVTTEHLAARAVTAEKIRSVDAAIAHIVAGDRTDLDHRGWTTWGVSDEATRAFISPGFAAKARKLAPLARVGDLTGLVWKGVPLPPGTHGVWARAGFFAGELLTLVGLQNRVLDGTIVDVSQFGWRRPAQLVVTPVDFLVNSPALGEMRVRSYAEHLSPTTFRVRCLMYAPGAAMSIGGSSRTNMYAVG